MINFKRGSITNPETGVTTDIVVKSMAPNTLRDALIGGCMVLAGIGYLTYTAFTNGAKKFEAAELKALSDNNLI